MIINTEEFIVLTGRKLPEVWIPYGSVEVAVDLKAENLSEVIKPNYPKTSVEELKEKLRSVDIKSSPLLILPKPTRSVLMILRTLLEEAREQSNTSSSITIATVKQSMSATRKIVEEFGSRLVQLENSKGENSGGLDIHPPDRWADHQQRVVLSQTNFDPIFGFSGGAIEMAKLSAKQLYLAALTHEFSEKNTGIISEASESALEVSDSLGDYTCIDVIGQGEDVSEVIIDQPRTTFQRSAERLLQLNHKTISEAGRAMIASPGTEAGKTLSTALSAFWNVMRGVKDGGIAILLAEASEGLGSTALQLYVSGRLDVDATIRKGQYVEGLEDLILLRRAQKLFKLVLVTSLPNYYSEVKLGLHALRKASDAVTEVFTNQGSKCKILMVSDASNTLISTNSH